MNLKEFVNEKRLIAPLMGVPGAKFIGSDLGEMLLNPVIHVRSILKLNEMFNPDILFMAMDLSIEAEALGLSVVFEPHKHPKIKNFFVLTEENPESLNWKGFFRSKRIEDYLKSAEILKKRTNVPLAAYVAGPFTLTTLLMGMEKMKTEITENPKFVKKIILRCSELIEEYAERLQKAGADLVVMLEPIATFLSPEAFCRLCGVYIKKIVNSGRIENPILHICGDTTKLLKEMEKTGVPALSLDSGVDLFYASEILNEGTIIIGNINPILFKDGNKEAIKDLTENLLAKMKYRKNFILSTGCDIPYDSREENIREFFKVFKEFTQ
ncbi:MAG: uroporphyrinogen decarboxylase [Kosmotogales bacterium]|nr:uroporphyrinogen decarboxylase [Kosmotogales bacterium]